LEKKKYYKLSSMANPTMAAAVVAQEKQVSASVVLVARSHLLVILATYPWKLLGFSIGNPLQGASS
jgi:hypothetical protein